MNQHEKAIAFLNNALKNGRWKPGDRLPNLVLLGKEAGVSHPVMGSAAQCLSKEGLLSVLRCSGIRVPLPDGNEKEATAGEYIEKWKKVRTNIINDLLGRALDSSSPLPSIQELCHRYSVSYPILKKALCSLEKEGLLSSYKRTYKLKLFPAQANTTKILVLFPFSQDKLNKNAINLQEKGFEISFRGIEILQKLEQMSNTQNITFDVWGYSILNNQPTFFNPELSICNSIKNIKSYFGIILINMYMNVPDFNWMVSMLALSSIPISIFDEAWDITHLLPKTKNNQVRIFNISKSDLDGPKMGQHLLKLGHQKIAYISPWFKDGWTKNRYNGLCKAFSMVSDKNQVSLFTDHRYPVGTIHLENEIFYEMPSLEEVVRSYKMLPDEQGKYFAVEMTNLFYAIIGQNRIGAFVEPLFEKALAQPDITAWVCSDSRMAFSALRFLHKKVVAIPGKISVAGFDDNPEAYTAGLTTYNYDVQGITQTMVAFISNPSLFPEKQGIFIEKNGFLVPRQSTGPARKE